MFNVNNIEYKTVKRSSNANVIIPNHNAIKNDKGDRVYQCSYCFSPSGFIDDVTEYDLDVDSFSNRKLMLSVVESTILVNETMDYDITIARYMKYNCEENKNLLFLVRSDATDKSYGDKDYIVIGSKNDNGVSLSIYTDIKNIDYIDDINFPNANVRDFLTFKNDDVVFNKDFEVFYDSNEKIKSVEKLKTLSEEKCSISSIKKKTPINFNM